MFNPFTSPGNKWRLLNPIWWLIFAIIFIYRIPSRFLPNRCRFIPSCSTYARDCLSYYGATKSTYLITKRIGKCHPFHPGGFDELEALSRENTDKDSKN